MKKAISELMKTDETKRKYEKNISVISFIVGLIFTVLPFYYSLFFAASDNIKYKMICSIIFGVAVIYQIYSFIIGRKKHYILQLEESLSYFSLKSQEQSNEAKSKSVLQITYGHEPEWHPFNFNKNYLEYDIHEHLRTILIHLRDAILNFSGQKDSDTVTVDLVYCYPDSTYSGSLPEPPDTYNNSTDNEQGKNHPWRIITSGDSSCTDYTLHNFLESKQSFYHYLDHKHFAFINDKTNFKSCLGHYIPSGKDYEYDGAGSIIGVAINIRNDQPEQDLVKAFLTITTYGWNLNSYKSILTNEEFGEVFKHCMINSYKGVLRSELSQMYIRHMLHDEKMCCYTGVIMKSDIVEKYDCPIGIHNNGELCPTTNHKCNCIRHKEAGDFCEFIKTSKTDI